MKKNDLLLDSGGYLLQILEKILDANIHIHGLENIPKDNPKIFVANHFTRSEAMILPYALYGITNKKVGVIADDSLFKTYFGDFLSNIGAMKKSTPCRNNIMIGDLITNCKDWLIFPEGSMVKAKDIQKNGKNYYMKIDGQTQRIFTGAAFFALSSQLTREDYFNNNIKNFEKFKRKYFINECTDISKEETMVVPINITYNKLRKGSNFLVDLAQRFLEDLGENFKEEIEIEGNIILNSKIDIQILKPLGTKKLLENIYKQEKDHTKIINKYRYELTHKFMRKIYESLTVSFDHIFALALFLSPLKKINKNQLKRVIYLSFFKIKDNCMLYDRDIEKDIINLISYEDFEPFEEILNIAINDGILKQDSMNYIIDKKCLLNSYTHHTVRLKNILRVVLNEVLIIEKVVNIVKEIINLPAKKLDKKLLNILIKEEENEYENDYSKYKNHEDIKDKSVGQPYLYENSSSSCVIAIHGFSSTPLEVKELCEYLYSINLNVYAPRLKGHGTVPIDLSTVSYKQWYHSVSRAITIASLKYKKIYIIGFSTGGLLALLSTKKQYIQFEGIVCINAALNLNDIRVNTLIPAVSVWNDLVSAFHANEYQKEYVDNNPTYPKINYNKHYITSIQELKKLMKKTKKTLPNISSPILILQSKDDPVVDANSAYEIYETIQSKNKRIEIIDSKEHVLIKSEEKESVFKKIKEFILKKN